MMMEIQIEDINTLNPATITTTTATTGVDGAGGAGVRHQVNVGESGDTLSGSVYLTLVLQHSTDNSNWSDVTDAEYAVDGTNSAFDASDGSFAVIDAAAEDDVLCSISYIGPNRYSRVNIELTGTHSNGIPVSGTAVTGYLRKQP